MVQRRGVGSQLRTFRMALSLISFIRPMVSLQGMPGGILEGGGSVTVPCFLTLSSSFMSQITFSYLLLYSVMKSQVIWTNSLHLFLIPFFLFIARHFPLCLSVCWCWCVCISFCYSPHIFVQVCQWTNIPLFWTVSTALSRHSPDWVFFICKNLLLNKFCVLHLSSLLLLPMTENKFKQYFIQLKVYLSFQLNMICFFLSHTF